MATSSNGATLYDIVRRYAALGDHRTGTPVDDATRGLVVSELENRGATVTRVGYSFDRYDVSSAVTVDDEPVPHVPLYYSGLGSWRTDTPFVGVLEMFHGVKAVDLDEQRREARERDAGVAVLATGRSEGRLVAENVAPGIDSGPLTVLVAGSDFERANGGPTRVEITARLVAGRSETVVARLGSADEAPVVVTTPLTGWFRCAGERATGIAVALDTAAMLAHDGHSVLFVGTTGHELEHFGVRHWLADTQVAPRAVLHCGASLAAGIVTDGECELSDLRLAMSNVDDDSLGLLADVLSPVRLTTIPGPENWGGEGEEWRKFGVPLLSCTGGFDRFHTPDDVPEAVTTPSVLESVRSAIIEAAHLLVNADTADA